MSMIVYQFDVAGRYLGETEADESPLEPGVYHFPARTTVVAPPARDTWPEGALPRWTGAGWAMTGTAPQQGAPKTDPLDKLTRFLQENPDVLAAMEKTPAS
jgi:hypothetical protein